MRAEPTERAEVRYHREITYALDLPLKPDGSSFLESLSDALEVVHHGFLHLTDGGWTGELSVAAPASVASASRAIGRYAARTFPRDTYDLRFADGRTDYLDVEVVPVEPVTARWREGTFTLGVTAVVGADYVDRRSKQASTDQERFVADAISGLTSRLGLALLDIEMVHFDGVDAILEMEFSCQTRGRTLGDLYRDGMTVVGYLSTLSSGASSARSALAMLADGNALSLLGSLESDWLEAKSSPYAFTRSDPDRSKEAARIELAQDVARFANGSVDGLLCVGLSTKLRRDKTEEIVAVAPVELARIDAKQYRKIIDARVFPPVEGLQVEVVRTDESHGLLAILVPAQPGELKPFLVHGAIAAGRVEGAFISIVRRRGDDTIPVSAASIHAALAAGRALLRYGLLPKEQARKDPGND